MRKNLFISTLSCIAILAVVLATPASAASRPSSVSAKLATGNAKAVISWNAAASNGSTVTGYQVAARKRVGSGWGSWSTYLVARTTRSKTVSFTNGSTVQGRVRARNAQGYAAWAYTTSKVVGVPTVPSAIGTTNGATVVDDTRITVTWGTAGSNGSAISAYKISRRYYTGSAWTSWATSTANSSARAYTFGTLATGRTYQFYVQGVNSKGVGPATATRTRVAKALRHGVETISAYDALDLPTASDNCGGEVDYLSDQPWIEAQPWTNQVGLLSGDCTAFPGEDSFAITSNSIYLPVGPEYQQIAIDVYGRGFEGVDEALYGYIDPAGNTIPGTATLLPGSEGWTYGPAVPASSIVDGSGAVTWLVVASDFAWYQIKEFGIEYNYLSLS